MIKTIWKYVLEAGGSNLIRMPVGASLLTVQMQGSDVCMWALVDPSAATEGRRFRVIGTGHRIENADALKYVSTFQPNEGGSPLVFHVFEEV